jgi:hypothetical protein
MVLSIIFLEDKHIMLLHLSTFYEYQQFFQRRICFSIQPQLQLVNTGHCNLAAVSRNRYGVEKTVDTHRILINAIQLYVCLQEIKVITKLPNFLPILFLYLNTVTVTTGTFEP